MSTERRGDEPDKSARTAAAADDAASGAPNLNGDWSNFFLLLLLYAIQGLPIGFIVSIPVLLQSNRNVTYRDQVRTAREPARGNPVACSPAGVLVTPRRVSVSGFVQFGVVAVHVETVVGAAGGRALRAQDRQTEDLAGADSVSNW